MFPQIRAVLNKDFSHFGVREFLLGAVSLGGNFGGAFLASARLVLPQKNFAFHVGRFVGVCGHVDFVFESDQFL